MTTITNLNSRKDRKIERLLNGALKKYDESTDDMQRFRNKLIVDEIYAFERTTANKACKKLDKSMGFIYFIENYKDYERCLLFFASKYIDEILYFKEDAETLIHDNYSTFTDYEDDRPRGFLIDMISKYDTDLSKFIAVNMSEIKPIDDFINRVGHNWYGYESDKNDCSQLISKLDAYFRENGNRCSITETDLLIYLFSKNDMLDDFKKYYIMEDTSPEEFDELIENNDVFDRIINKDGKPNKKFSINDIKLIAEMDKIIRENISNKGKRLKF